MNKEKFILNDEQLTFNKFIGFEFVDGEVLVSYKKLFDESDNYIDQYRFVEKISENIYKTYIFPTVKEFKKGNINIDIYITTKDDIINQLIKLNNSNCIYNFDFKKTGNIIHLDNMLWHYIGCFCDGYTKKNNAIDDEKFLKILKLVNKHTLK